MKSFSEADGVWSPDFVSTVVVQLTDPNSQLSHRDRDALLSLGARALLVAPDMGDDTKFLPPGPYFLHHGRLFIAYRLYLDTVGAFIAATVPAGDDG